MIPAPLRRRLWPHVAHGVPQKQRAITDHARRRGQASRREVAKSIARPRWPLSTARTTFVPSASAVIRTNKAAFVDSRTAFTSLPCAHTYTGSSAERSGVRHCVSSRLGVPARRHDGPHLRHRTLWPPGQRPLRSEWPFATGISKCPSETEANRTARLQFTPFSADTRKPPRASRSAYRMHRGHVRDVPWPELRLWSPRNRAPRRCPAGRHCQRSPL